MSWHRRGPVKKGSFIINQIRDLTLARNIQPWQSAFTYGNSLNIQHFNGYDGKNLCLENTQGLHVEIKCIISIPNLLKIYEAETHCTYCEFHLRGCKQQNKQLNEKQLISFSVYFAEAVMTQDCP